jgi:hypothetical protein
VYIWNATSNAATTARPKTIAMLQTETGMLILITDQNCPPDVREFIEYQTNKQFGALRKMMAEQGFKPSNPTTQPAGPGTGTGAKPPAGAPKKNAAPEKADEPPGKDL